MRVWLYARLSRDEDSELNSLTNQQNILREYAEKNSYEIAGESADDNISGMHFNRPGINEIYAAVEEKRIDAVVVKDLSRLGRHRTQTAMFIDFLRENDVRVLSVTENIDTSNGREVFNQGNEQLHARHDNLVEVSEHAVYNAGDDFGNRLHNRGDNLRQRLHQRGQKLNPGLDNLRNGVQQKGNNGRDDFGQGCNQNRERVKKPLRKPGDKLQSCVQQKRQVVD